MIRLSLSAHVLNICFIIVFSVMLTTGALAQQSVQVKNGHLNLVSVTDHGGKKTTLEGENQAFHLYGKAAAYQAEYFLILQFEDILSSEDRTLLARQGVHLDQYITGHAYLARVAQDIHVSSLIEYGFKGYARPVAENKLSRSFNEFLTTETSGTYLVRASFSSSVSEADLRNAVAMTAGVSSFKFVPGSTYFTAQVSPQTALQLAELPFIQAIEPHSDDIPFDSVIKGADYSETDYADIQSTHIRANVLKSMLPGHFGLSGNGVVVGLGDAVYQGETHVDMRGRHQVLDPGLTNNGGFSEHGNHTSGTVGGNGSIQPRFEGLAPETTIYTMRTGDHFALGLSQADPMVISSNSWNTSDPEFGSDYFENKGQYNIHSQSIDLLLRTETNLLAVFSAGNSGDTQTGYPAGYLMLNPSYGAAKNTLVVGRRAYPLGYYNGPSFGPARDGRIKPDLVAQHNVHSGVAFNEYQTFQGSSQSTPAVSGTAALLYEHYRNLNAGKTPDGALIKAILMNTADYQQDLGPTYQVGYGLVNARRAAQVITSTQHIKASVSHAGEITIPIEVPATVEGINVAQLKVMLYWTDKEASPYSETALVNNLDLMLSDGSINHLPWVLDSTRANVELPATRGVDTLNNTEQVLIESPSSGTYTATISGTSIPFGPQEFYLVYSYVLDELVITHPNGGEKFFGGQNKVVFWDTQNIGANRQAENIEYSTNGGSNWTSFFTNSFSVRPNLNFTIPVTPLSEALVRVTQGGRTTVSAPFTISEKISLSIVDQGGDVQFDWNKVEGAASYELVHLANNDQWEVFQTLSDTTSRVAKSEIPERTKWMSVRAVSADNSLRSQRADARQYVSGNVLPLANEDIVYINLNAVTTIDVLANDSDQDGDAIFIREVSSATHGEVTVRDNQVLRYWPESGYAGLDSFTYTIDDGHGGTSIGTVTVSVASGVATEEDLALPTEFKLMGNYPNPFNPSTTIRYALPVTSPVRLSVYDALGRRVALLVDSQIAAGWHNVTFESRSLASGMYFYRLEATDFVLTRSMFLLK